ncbi:MAG TPA: alpha/beta hydrolase [Streptosporangiaceae bacterium]|jgi:acetyl esterase|nr:alpha/beta hydrolase [Streptosporangiaceae bacterium]
MRLDPAVARFLRACEDAAPAELPLADRRECLRLLLDLNFVRYGTPGPDLPRIAEYVVPVTGDSIRIRLYYPAEATQVQPVHVVLHGGGWWQGSIDDRVNEAGCRRLAADSGVVVAAVDYRLAPENPFPAGLEDCCAALRWLAAEAAGLGLDPLRISVGGNSAGAGLAAAVTLVARDNESLPSLVFQLLEVPALDISHDTGGANELVTPVGLYLPDPGLAELPTASPLLAPDLSGLPPACIYVAEHDALRRQGEAYARRLAEAGVAVTVEFGTGGVHGSLLLTRIWPPAAEWQRKAARLLAAAHRSAIVPEVS